jgi:hypothetical protein
VLQVLLYLSPHKRPPFNHIFRQTNAYDIFTTGFSYIHFNITLSSTLDKPICLPPTARNLITINILSIQAYIKSSSSLRIFGNSTTNFSSVALFTFDSRFFQMSVQIQRSGFDSRRYQIFSET